MNRPRISVIVPALDEEESIGETLESVGPQRPHEVILVDGGSADRTVDLARGRVDQVLAERGGLARQLNRGAAQASGDVLLFQYADTLLPSAALDGIAGALADGRVVGGAFRLGFDSDRLPFPVIAGFGNLRNRLGLGPFGDQAIFVRRDTFFEVGQFRPQRFLEDLDLVRRLRRRGRFRVLPMAVKTSVRRWQRHGLLRTLLVHWGMSAAFLLGKRHHGSWLGTRAQALRTRR